MFWRAHKNPTSKEGAGNMNIEGNSNGVCGGWALKWGRIIFHEKKVNPE